MNFHLLLSLDYVAVSFFSNKRDEIPAAVRYKYHPIHGEIVAWLHVKSFSREKLEM